MSKQTEPQKEQPEQSDLDAETPPWLQPVPEVEEGGTTSKRFTFIAYGAAIVSVAGLAGAIWLAQSGGSDGPVRHVRAPVGPIKSIPTDDARGGKRMPDQDKEVLAAAAGQSPASTVKVGPLPEQPLTELPTNSAPNDNGPDEADVKTQSAGKATKQPSTNPVAEAVPVASRKPVPKPAIETKPAPENGTGSSKPDAGEGAKAAEAAAVPVASTDFRLQLGAFGDQKAAQAAWRSARGRLANLVRDLKPDYESLSTSDGALIRLRVGPLADRAKADALCLAVREKNLPCFVVPPGS